MDSGDAKARILGRIMLVVGAVEALSGSWVGLKGGSSQTVGVALAFGAALGLFGVVLVRRNR